MVVHWEEIVIKKWDLGAVEKAWNPTNKLGSLSLLVLKEHIVFI